MNEDPGQRSIEVDPVALPVGRAASRALAWSFVNTALGRFGSVAIGIVLARLLGPTEFGEFAVASVALLAILSINDVGVSLAIIRWPGDPAGIAPTVNTLSVISSVVLALTGIALAPTFAGAMGDSGAAFVVQVLLISVITDGLAATPAALLQREFRGGRRTAIDQVNIWTGAILSVVGALLGFGAMSLAIGRLTGSVISAVMFIASSPLPYRFGFDRSEARQLLRFGLPLAGSSLLVFAIGYSDQLVAGSVLGTTALGFYVLAFNISSWPISILSQPVRTVAPATFARLQHDQPKMMVTLRTMLGSLARLTVPACVSIAGAAVPIVLLLYGTAWSEAATVLPWLALNAIFRIMFELFYDFMVVLRRSMFIMIVQAVWLAVLIPALIVGARHFGLPGLAAAQVIVAVAVVLPMYLAGNRRVGLRVTDVLARTWLPIVAGLLAGAISFFISANVTNNLLACVLSGTVAALTIAALLTSDRGALRNLRNLSV